MDVIAVWLRVAFVSAMGIAGGVSLILTMVGGYIMWKCPELGGTMNFLFFAVPFVALMTFLTIGLTTTPLNIQNVDFHKTVVPIVISIMMILTVGVVAVSLIVQNIDLQKQVNNLTNELKAQNQAKAETPSMSVTNIYGTTQPTRQLEIRAEPQIICKALIPQLGDKPRFPPSTPWWNPPPELSNENCIIAVGYQFHVYYSSIQIDSLLLSIDGKSLVPTPVFSSRVVSVFDASRPVPVDGVAFFKYEGIIKPAVYDNVTLIAMSGNTPYLSNSFTITISPVKQ